MNYDLQMISLPTPENTTLRLQFILVFGAYLGGLFALPLLLGILQDLPLADVKGRWQLLVHGHVYMAAIHWLLSSFSCKLSLPDFFFFFFDCTFACVFTEKVCSEQIYHALHGRKVSAAII